MSRLSNSPDVINEAQGFLAALGFGTQGVNVVSVTAATALNPTAPAALTAVNPTAPAAFTVPLVAQAVAVVSEAATDLDTVAAAVKTLHTEVITYETAISALVADAVASRLEAVTYEVAISALVLDVAEIRTKVNAILSSLETGGIMASS